MTLISQIDATSQQIRRSNGFRLLTGGTQQFVYKPSRALQAARANTAAATQRLWSRLTHITPRLLLRRTPGNRLDEDAGGMRDETKKHLTLGGGRGGREGEGRYEKTPAGGRARPRETQAVQQGKNTMRRATMATDRGHFRTVARLLKGSKLLPATETTPAATAQLYQTDASAQARRNSTSEGHASAPRCDIRPQHVIGRIRDAKRHAHPGPSGERNSHISAWLASSRDLPLLTRCVQLWFDRRLSPAFTEPWIQAKVNDGAKGGCKAPPIASKSCSSSSPRLSHLTQVRRATGPIQHGIYHKGGGRSCVEGSRANANPFSPATSRTDAERPALGSGRRPDLGAKYWVRSSPTCGMEEHKFNQRHGQNARWMSTHRGQIRLPPRDVRGPSGIRLGSPHRTGGVR